MTEKSLTPDELVIHRLVIQNPVLEDLLGKMEQFSPEQRTLAKEALWSLRSKEDLVFQHRYIVVAAFLEDLTPARMTYAIGKRSLKQLASDEPALSYVVKQLTARGKTWAQEFVAAVLKKRALPNFAVPLLDPLIREFDLPLPDKPQYWMGWVRDHSMPTPNSSWEQYFIKACSVPDTFIVRLDDKTDKTAYMDQVSWRIRELRKTEPTDDPALLRALLQIFDRTDCLTAQRLAMVWIEALGLTHLMQDARAQVTAALPDSDLTFANTAVEQLLAADLSDDELTHLALAILPRKKQKRQRMKGTVLDAIARLETPSQELLEAVKLIAAGPDTTNAAQAKELLTRWGDTSHKEVEILGLWRPPAGRDKRPLHSYTLKSLVLDNLGLALLLAELDIDRRSKPDLQERTLAALVATAHAHGVEKVRHAIRICIDSSQSGGSLLRRLLAKLDEQGDDVLENLGMLGSAPLTFLALQRAIDALNRLGELPCLLSAPTHAGYRIAWGAFAARARRYRETKVKVLPTDVAVALARLDRSEVPEDLSELTQAIRGVPVTLAAALRYWREHPSRVGRFRLLPSDSKKYDSSYYQSERLEVDGDEPTVHDMLKLRNSWTLPYKPVHAHEEDPWVSVLLPEHPTRPASMVLHTSMTIAPDNFERIATTAPKIGPVGAFAALEMASRVDASKENERIAALLFTAWDEERMTADDLVAAWNNPWRKAWDLSRSRAMRVLGIVADTGGLALAWPLLSTIAEEVADQERVPPQDSGMLELALRYIPEVRAAGILIELPNITALAARPNPRGSKALSIARQIVQAMNQPISPNV